MCRTRNPIPAILLLLLLPSFAIACLWDYDTLLAERARFPTALELITGKFLRHSPVFYEWRVQDRLQKLEKDPDSLAYLDDLAVAYDKLGKQDLAIELMERKEQLKPGLYETAANHGTFHAHAGRLAEALPFLKKAIEINPDAHFGREKYQILLIEYSMAKPVDQSFCDFVAAQHTGHFSLADQQAAIKGVLGIMRFGNQDNPKVLAALGSLLMFGNSDNPDHDGKALAARAYLKAASLTKDRDRAREWRKEAERAIGLQSGVQLETVEDELRRELADADAWYAELRDRELNWIKSGVDVDAEFAKLYQADPVVVQTRNEGNLSHTGTNKRAFRQIIATVIGIFVFLLLALVGAVYGLIRALRRPRSVEIGPAKHLHG